jgi:adenosylhomocysteine nucleosidase
MTTPRLGIVTGLKSESALVLNALAETVPRPPVMVQCRGMGPERATQAAHILINAGCTALMSFGIAGGLEPRLAPGALLLPRSILHYPASEDHPSISVDPRWHLAVASRFKRDISRAMSNGPMVSTAHVVAGVADKASLHKALGAVAVDMESHSVATVAHAAGLPFLVLRVVADGANHAIPEALGKAIRDDGEIDMQAALWALVRQPWLFPEARRLQRISATAHAGLDSLLRSDLLGRAFLMAVTQE